MRRAPAGLGPPLAVAFFACALSLDLGAQVGDEPPPPPPPGRPATGDAPAPETPVEEVVEEVAEALSTVVFRPVSWFDRLFGDERFVPERAERGLGLAGIGVEWSRVDGYDVPLRGRVDYPFPFLRERVSAIFLGGEEDEIDTDRDSWIGRTARPQGGLRDTTYLAGLGYMPFEGRKSRLQLRVGTRLGSTSEALVQARYRYRTFFGDDYGVRFAGTVFYRTALGPGATAVVDADKALGARSLVRLTLEATHHTRVRGLDWGAGVTAFRRVGAEAAMSLTVATEGKRGGPVTPRYAGVRGSYRWPLIRNRLVADVSAGIARARREAGQPWMFSPSVGLLLELTFVEKPRVAGPPPP